MIILIGVLAFVLSAIEEWMASRRTQAIVSQSAVRSANWSAAFDFVLFVDVYLIVAQGWWIVVPICMGSWVGSWWSVHSRRDT